MRLSIRSYRYGVLPNIVIFLAALSPILISSYFILDSAFNYNVKGYILAVGLLLTQGLGIISRSLWNRVKPHFRGLGRRPTGDEKELNDFCEIFELPYKARFGIYSAPSTHAIFHSFILLGNSSSSLGTPSKSLSCMYA